MDNCQQPVNEKEDTCQETIHNYLKNHTISDDVFALVDKVIKYKEAHNDK